LNEEFVSLASLFPLRDLPACSNSHNLSNADGSLHNLILFKILAVYKSFTYLLTYCYISLVIHCLERLSSSDSLTPKAHPYNQTACL